MIRRSKRVHSSLAISCRLLNAETNPVDGAAMVWVPVGTFLMGSDDGSRNEKPQRAVYLDGYWIYTTLVTVAQYRRFCEATRRKMAPAPAGGWLEDHPIVNVSWYDAQAYCAWAGVSLPTEAQWEKAARGTDGRIYPWGEAWEESRCACSGGDNHPVSASPVGCYPSSASPFGCLDMAGNVWEWCADWFQQDYYPRAPMKNPTGPETGVLRVLRGGSWLDYTADSFRTATRNWIVPSYGNVNIGFRCVLRSDLR